MVFRENRLLADDSHEISCLIFFQKLGKSLQNLSPAAVVIGALRVNGTNLALTLYLLVSPAENFCKQFKTQIRSDETSGLIRVQTF